MRNSEVTVTDRNLEEVKKTLDLPQDLNLSLSLFDFKIIWLLAMKNSQCLLKEELLRLEYCYIILL